VCGEANCPKQEAPVQPLGIHLPESHLNSYVRFKWALPEDRPVIQAYWEDRWAELGDYEGTPVEVSLDLLRSLRTRWCVLLRFLT
jgi:hypothetical protein